ncbi:type IV toxin-antitoxin system AbiEi family antitoxin domain-containing protein [Arcobacter sp.]|uniref:type IV toxin-antitoxin system AbiEi family antitoxin domain-containing protein n=1 Tax=Arcobacter sp. TaxID=1872629 RepID=UPI003D0A9B57
MNIFDIRKKLSLNTFSVEMIKSILQEEYSHPVQKINAMIKKGELIQLKKGIYTFSEDYRNHSLNLISTANMLYKPSYVSFEYALSFYSLIPERVYTITSASTSRSKEFETPLGRFSYTKIPLIAYSLGIDWKFDENDGGYMIATAEKALCDKIYTDKRVSNIKKDEIESYLEEDLRIDIDDLKSLDSKLIWKISMAYSSKTLQSLASIIKRS